MLLLKHDICRQAASSDITGSSLGLRLLDCSLWG